METKKKKMSISEPVPNGHRGITLIALVITIIVLLILAAVSIATLTGENGVITQAGRASDQTKIAEIIEQAKIDIIEMQAEKTSVGITEKELKEILENYGELEGDGELLDKTLVTNDGYKISVKEIYNGALEMEPVILEVGDYVKYNVTYTDIYTENEFTSETGWRVLETGTNNGDGTYTGLKLISTGVPAQIYYSDITIRDKEYNGTYGNWAGDKSQRNEYANLFWSSYNNNNDNKNMYAVAGLYYNFTKIRFSTEVGGEYDMPNSNEAFYVKINGQTEGELAEDTFLKDGAIRVYNLTLAELNTVRGESDLRSTNALNDNDGAKGLFKLSGLGEYGYDENTTWEYYLASPDTSSNAIYNAIDWIDIIDYGMGPGGLRPVIELPDNFKVEKTK